MKRANFLNVVVAALWQDMNATQIAERMGITRGAVMGRVFRMRRKGVDLREEILPRDLR